MAPSDYSKLLYAVATVLPAGVEVLFLALPRERDNFWAYGVIEPLSGWHFEQEYAHLNSEQFQSFLNALSTAFGEDIALIQLDQAKAHQGLHLHSCREPDSGCATCSQSTVESSRTIVAVSQISIRGRTLYNAGVNEPAIEPYFRRTTSRSSRFADQL